MSLDVILLVVAAVLLFLDGARVNAGRVNLQSLAFAFLVCSVIVWRY